MVACSSSAGRVSVRRLVPAKGGRGHRRAVRMSPEPEVEKERGPLDFPREWRRGRPANKPDIVPEFKPLWKEKPMLPNPTPEDPPPLWEEVDQEDGEGPDISPNPTDPEDPDEWTLDPDVDDPDEEEPESLPEE